MIEIIAEIGINHNGDLDIAKKLIDVAVDSGCNYVKFQKRDINMVYSQAELETPRQSPWGTTTREQKDGLEFTHNDYVTIDNYCAMKEIKWFASPWDIHSATFLTDFDTPFIKIPSALITNFDLLQDVKEMNRPVIISTGMSTPLQVKSAVEFLGEQRIHCIMACTSTYPTEPREVNAKYIQTLRYFFPNLKIGFSNHYPGLTAMLTAVALGAEMLEFHLTLDRTMYGSDQASSIEPQGAHELRRRVDLMMEMIGDGIKRIYDSERPILQKLRR